MTTKKKPAILLLMEKNKEQSELIQELRAEIYALTYPLVPKKPCRPRKPTAPPSVWARFTLEALMRAVNATMGPTPTARRVVRKGRKP